MGMMFTNKYKYYGWYHDIPQSGSIHYTFTGRRIQDNGPNSDKNFIDKASKIVS